MGKPSDVVIVVDEKDEVLAYKTYSEVLPTDRWRDTAIVIFNKDGDILLAQRHPNKRVLPNKWGPAASGTVESHESYEQNAYKELQEELGITGVPLQPVGTYCMDFDSHNRYTGLFVGTWNGNIDDLTLEEGQVAAVKWMKPADLQADVSKHPEMYIPKLDQLIERVSAKNS